MRRKWCNPHLNPNSSLVRQCVCVCGWICVYVMVSMCVAGWLGDLHESVRKVPERNRGENPRPTAERKESLRLEGIKGGRPFLWVHGQPEFSCISSSLVFCLFFQAVVSLKCEVKHSCQFTFQSIHPSFCPRKSCASVSLSDPSTLSSSKMLAAVHKTKPGAASRGKRDVSSISQEPPESGGSGGRSLLSGSLHPHSQHRLGPNRSHKVSAIKKK